MDESDALLSFVAQTALSNNVDSIVILGDLMHTFGIVRTEVIYFWKEWLSTLSDICKVNVLVGNHDMKNQGNDEDSEHALDIFNLLKKKNLSIIDLPKIDGPFGFVPYIHDKNKFVEAANRLTDSGAKVIICHADFDGAQYENGFYAPNGIKQEDLKTELVISGHIHKRSRFGKIIYPGTARWLTSSDANEEKGLWLVEHDDINGAILNEQFIDTSGVCSPILKYEVKEGENYPEFPEGSRVSIHLVGSSEWILKEKQVLKGKASVSCKITDKQVLKTRNSGKNVSDFLDNFYKPSQGISKESIKDFMKEINIL